MENSKLSTLAKVPCRMCFVHIFNPSAIEGQEPKYSVVCLLDKNNAKAINMVKQAVAAAIQQGRQRQGFTDAVLNSPKFSNPLRDGDVDRAGRPEFAGCYFITAKSKTRPQVVDRNCQPIMDQNEVYSGCYGYVSMNFYPFSMGGNFGIAAGLNNVMKAMDGDFLGGRASAEADFAGIDFTSDFGQMQQPAHQMQPMQPQLQPQQLQQRYQPQQAYQAQQPYQQPVGQYPPQQQPYQQPYQQQGDDLPF